MKKSLIQIVLIVLISLILFPLLIPTLEWMDEKYNGMWWLNIGN
jgi:hypothetical protein